MISKTVPDEKSGKLLSPSWQVPACCRSRVAALSRTCLLISVGVALGNWTLIWANLVAAHYLHNWWLLVYPAQLLLIARSLRAFENLTHEGSHRNWHRQNRKLNDFFADWLCARWVGLSTKSFRTTHMPHHWGFGTEVDPCLSRYQALGLDSLDRRSGSDFVTKLFGHMFSYLTGYWQAYGVEQRRQILTTGLLHIGVMVLGSFSLWSTFWILWLLYVLVAFGFVLPVLRLWAEASKHQYAGQNPELESTYSNVGWIDRWLIHPCGDSFHLLHHYLPSIPHHRMHRVHELLLRYDAQYMTSPKVRTSIFDEPDPLF
jgi:fatty acid desaturase